MIESMTKAELLGALSALASPGAQAAASLIAAAESEVFLPRATATAELLEIYERRLRMGALDSTLGGLAFVESLRRLQDAEVLMVVVESPVGVGSVWVTVDGSEAVGALALPLQREGGRGL